MSSSCTEWMIYHLIHNDDQDFTKLDDLDIDLIRSDTDQWERFLLGLSRNRTLTSIGLCRGYQTSVVTEEDIQRLFHALRELSTLKTVQLHSFSMMDLENSRSLFVHHPTIERVVIENGRSTLDDESDNSDMDAYRIREVCEGLSSMHRLRKLVMEVPTNLCFDESFEPLMKSPFLGELTLQANSLERTTVPRMASTLLALRTHPHLLDLDLDLPLPVSDLLNLVQLIKDNQKLRKLTLRLDLSQSILLSFQESILSLWDSLQTSQLTVFHQYGSGLKYSSWWKELRVSCLKMLEHNYFLREFSCFLFDDVNDSHQPHVIQKSAYLRWNRQGRIHVCHPSVQATESQWVHQLSKTSHDLDGLYYYLSIHPSICNNFSRRKRKPAELEANGIQKKRLEHNFPDLAKRPPVCDKDVARRW